MERGRATACLAVRQSVYGFSPGARRRAGGGGGWVGGGGGWLHLHPTLKQAVPIKYYVFFGNVPPPRDGGIIHFAPTQADSGTRHEAGGLAVPPWQRLSQAGSKVCTRIGAPPVWLQTCTSRARNPVSVYGHVEHAAVGHYGPGHVLCSALLCSARSCIFRLFRSVLVSH